MKTKMRRVLILLAPLALTACAITQTVQPVSQLQDQQICVVENPAVVQPGFLNAYVRNLGEKGYAVKMLPSDAPVTACPTTSTYTANWRWDLALYMAYAEIKVYSGGKEAGKAVYDSLQGGFNLNKFVRGEEKIKELVDQLFPQSR